MNISQIYILGSIIVLAVIVLPVFVIVKRRNLISMNIPLFAMGLVIVSVAVVLLLADVIESGVAAVFGIVGIGLIAASGRPNTKTMR